MMQGEAIWKFSNKIPSLSAIKYLTRGTKCVQSDIPTKLQILNSYRLKDICKWNIQEQNNERYSFVVPCGNNNSLFNSERSNSMYGIPSLLLYNQRARPMGQLQEFLSCLSSAVMFQILKDAGIIKSTMSLPSMQQMCIPLSICKINNSDQSKGELNAHELMCGMYDKQGEKRNICTTDTTQGKKIECSPPKKSKGEGNNDTCDSEETTVKTGAKGDSRKDSLIPKHQSHTFCEESSPKTQMKASAPLQESHCGKSDGKKEILMPKNQPTQTFCAKGENRYDQSSALKTQLKASGCGSTQGAKGPDQKSSKKDDCKKEGCGSKCPDRKQLPKEECKKKDPCAAPKSPPKTDSPKCSDRKGASKDECKKKDPCAKPQTKAESKGCESKSEPKCEPKGCENKEDKTDSFIQCAPKAQEKKRGGCEPDPKCSGGGPSPDRKQKVGIPCPKIGSKKDGGAPLWQCAMVGGIIFLVLCLILWLATRKSDDDDKDPKGKGKRR